MKSKFLEQIKAKAKENPARILFPEADDPRVQEAIKITAAKGIAKPIILDFKEDNSKYIDRLVELRVNKGMNKKLAQKLIKQANYLATLKLEMGEVDAVISGNQSSTADTLRAAFQVIGTEEKFHKVSGFFFIILNDKVMLFADCSVNIEPSSNELAEIAIDTAETAQKFGLKPKIAMLSFSTRGSAKHPLVDKVKEATAMVKHYRPDLLCEGELQVDAALVAEVCEKKFPESQIMGEANILIFPSLEAGNIAYKLVERLAKAHAIGPILQGLKKPFNDLSRGCSVEDIVDLAAITSVQVQGWS